MFCLALYVVELSLLSFQRTLEFSCVDAAYYCVK